MNKAVSHIRQSLADECYAGLRALIVNCDIAPGSRFTEKELIQRTGFGRTPVREALARLDQEGLVNTLPRSGYLVTDVTPRSVGDLFDVWKLIGPLIVRRAWERLDDAMWARLEELAEGLGSTQSTTDVIDKSNALFDMLAEATGNQDLIFFSRRLGSEMGRIYTLYLRTEEGHGWFDEQYRFWQGITGFRDPEVAAARVAFAIAVSHAGIARLVEDYAAAKTNSNASQK